MKYVIKYENKNGKGKDEGVVSGLVYFDLKDAQYAADQMNQSAPSHIYYFPVEMREWERKGSMR